MKTETVEYVELDHTMPVTEMNYTQAFMEPRCGADKRM